MSPPPPVSDTTARRLVGAPPGPRQRDLRSAAILDAAALLFVEKGISGTSIDDIVVQAGVAKGTFYHYFQDRAAMLEALRRRYCQHFADCAAEATDACPENDWPACLDAWINAVVAEYLASYALHDAIFHDPSVCHRCVMSEEPVVRHLADLLESGSRAGAWAVENPIATAVCMFHALHGLVDEAIAKETATGDIAPYLSRLFANMVRR